MKVSFQRKRSSAITLTRLTIVTQQAHLFSNVSQRISKCEGRADRIIIYAMYIEFNAWG